MATLVPVILCGGTGTRLWPLSRASYPKQYWALAGQGEETLLQQTQQRLEGIADLQPPLLISNEDHRFNVAEQMRRSAWIPRRSCWAVGRNTAPAVAIAAPGPLPRATTRCCWCSPDRIRDGAAFRQTVQAGVQAAESGQLVTFGIVPTAPETGYGIEAAQPLGDAAPRPIAGSLETAPPPRLLATGRFT